MRPFAFAVSVAIGAGAVPTVVDAQIAGRAVPGPIYGVTFDNVTKPTAETNALAQIVKMPTVRVVFDRGVNPSDYKVPIQQFRTAAYVMGELADPSEMDGYTVSSITTMAQNYTTTLGSLVD